MKIMLVGCTLLAWLIVPLFAFAGPPLDTVKANVNSVLEVLRDPKLKGETGRKVKEQRITAAAEKLFDFVELSKRTLGLNWNNFTPEQRKEFVQLFEGILKDAYVEKIMAYTNEQVNFTKEAPLSETTVEVDSVVTTKGSQVPINYRVIKKENEWRVYDVVIEGVSLISNYRTQFREILGTIRRRSCLKPCATKRQVQNENGKSNAREGWKALCHVGRTAGRSAACCSSLSFCARSGGCSGRGYAHTGSRIVDSASQVREPAPAAAPAKPSDEYGNVTSEEVEATAAKGTQIADPIEPWNRAMYHFNDKFYFWLLKPVTRGYKAAVPEDFRGLFSNFYRNLKAPIRIVNNMLQGEPGYAGKELARLVINSTIGVGGLRDCAGECFGIKGRDADFGQTLGKYGVGFGFYIVWPILGPSCPRDTVGFVGDWLLRPATYLSSNFFDPVSIGLYAHEAVNTTSFHLGDYEAIKAAAIDPYVAIRDGYVQHRTEELKR